MTWFSKSPASSVGTHQYVHRDGSVSRFVFERRKLTKEGKPKPHVFEQERHPEHGRLETSVCGMNGTTDDRLWSLGHSIRAPLHAIAVVEVPVTSIESTGLECIPDAMPQYDEHGVIVGWDQDDKSKRLALQQDLAVAHSRVRYPPGPAQNCH